MSKNLLMTLRTYCISFLLLPWQVTIYLAAKNTINLSFHSNFRRSEFWMAWTGLTKLKSKHQHGLAPYWRYWRRICSQVHSGCCPSSASCGCKTKVPVSSVRKPVFPPRGWPYSFSYHPWGALCQCQVKGLFNLESLWLSSLSAARKMSLFSIAQVIITWFWPFHPLKKFYTTSKTE